MEKLSVALITKNNEGSVRDCLESLKWADEIVVLDGFSTDRTAAICREYTGKVFQKPFESFPRERTSVLEKTTHRWVLSVDADMVFPPAFCDEVRRILENPRYDGYRCRSLTTFLGREIRHCGWFDTRYLRLFNKEAGEYDLSMSVLDKFRVRTGRVGVMQAHLVHHQNESFAEYFGKIERYSRLTALEYRAKGVRITSLNALYYLGVKPALVFLNKYVRKCGFLDGIPGLVVCINSAVSYYSSYAALWDLQRTEGR
jgi:glycosyltransferase involved in cell wall biosynthesis